MKKKFQKVFVAAAMIVGFSAGVANARGHVCVGTKMYESVGFWIFQFPVGEGLESQTCAEMMQ